MKPEKPKIWVPRPLVDDPDSPLPKPIRRNLTDNTWGEGGEVIFANLPRGWRKNPDGSIYNRKGKLVAKEQDYGCDWYNMDKLKLEIITLPCRRK